jgi:hypothetical protein
MLPHSLQFALHAHTHTLTRTHTHSQPTHVRACARSLQFALHTLPYYTVTPYGEYTVLLAGKSPNIRSDAVH